MKYIEQNDNRTCTYEIIVDEVRLKALMVLLDRDCYVKRVGMRMLDAYTKDEAAEKIKEVSNHAGILENIDFGGINLTENQVWYHGQPYEAHYEAVYKDSVDLVHWINYILENKDSKDQFDKEYCIKCFEDIKNYKNSIDFIPFEERVQVAENRLNEALLSPNKENQNLLELVKNYGNTCIEARLNENYNYQRLAELYMDVLECFKFVLVEEVIRYKKR